MDRLGPLNAFLHAAETRSFTAAGRELGISASGVGKTIARLEERLGVRLFHRNTRNIALTSEGERFLARCQAVFRELDAAETEIAHAAARPRGKLRVSLPLIGMLMTEAVAEFAETYPEIELELDFSDRIVDVVQEGFDVVIRTGKVEPSALKRRKLGTYGYVIVGSPAYFERRGTPAAPEDLAGHACLYHRWPSNGKLERWDFGSTIDFTPTPSLVVTTMEPLIGLAERGIGIMYTPVFTVRKQLAAGTLKSVLGRYLPGEGTLQALWPASRQDAPKVKAFVDLMARSLVTA